MPATKATPKTKTAAKEVKPYSARRMSHKHASSAARDMRSGNKEAAKYMSSYRKHMQVKRSQEATARVSSGQPASLSTPPPGDQLVPQRAPMSSLPRPQ